MTFNSFTHMTMDLYVKEMWWSGEDYFDAFGYTREALVHATEEDIRCSPQSSCKYGSSTHNIGNHTLKYGRDPFYGSDYKSKSKFER